MTAGRGDPASISALGGALRSQALELVALLERLAPRTTRGTPPAGPLDPDRERELVATTAEQLDRIGAALQALASGEVEREARRRSLADQADRVDLQIDGNRVVECPGPSRVDPQRRVLDRERLQQLLGRLAAAHGRELGALTRELQSSARALELLSERIRDGRD